MVLSMWRESDMVPIMADRSGLAAERMGTTAVRVETRRTRTRARFVALEGPLLVAIEADSEDEARGICAEEGLEFVCLCDDLGAP
jgi:hypothetical protein